MTFGHVQVGLWNCDSETCMYDLPGSLALLRGPVNLYTNLPKQVCVSTSDYFSGQHQTVGRKYSMRSPQSSEKKLEAYYQEIVICIASALMSQFTKRTGRGDRNGLQRMLSVGSVRMEFPAKLSRLVHSNSAINLDHIFLGQRRA